MTLKNNIKENTITVDKKLYDKLISNEKDAKQEIEKSLHLNNILLDAIPHNALLVNKDRVILAANKKARRVGKKVGEKCYKGFSICKQFCYKGINCCFCKKGLDLDDMDSKHLEVEAYGYAWDTWWIPIDNNSFLYYSIDITDRKKIEQNLREAAKELKISNKELEQFAYVTSHDLQEPLRVVSTYCQLIEFFIEKNCDKLDKDKDRELKQYIYFTVDAVNRMRFLIKDLLEFSRVGKTDNNYEMVDVNEIIEETIKDFTISIKEHNVIMKYSAMPIIMGKRRLISQIFHNLISNAIKFKSEKDVVISINVEERKNDWLFSVIDTGIGIDITQQNRIFGIFKRLHTREEYPGTGIGLALVKKMVENHGGKIWVESSLNEGSTFFFTIPKSWEIIKSGK